MKLRLTLFGTAALFVVMPVSAQDANVEGRVVKLEKEMRAVQREVFPNGAGKFFEPEIKPADGKTTTTTSSSTAVADLLARVDALETQLATLTGQVGFKRFQPCFHRTHAVAVLFDLSGQSRKLRFQCVDPCQQISDRSR